MLLPEHESFFSILQSLKSHSFCFWLVVIVLDFSLRTQKPIKETPRRSVPFVVDNLQEASTEFNANSTP